MSKLLRSTRWISALLCLSVAGFAMAAPPRKSEVPKEPAKVRIDVAPDSVEPGGRATVQLLLEPKAGIVINRYPKIKLTVPAAEGKVAAAEAAIGNDRPPKLSEKSESNYFEPVEPLELALQLDRSIPPGAHQIDAKLVYFYCVKKSGFCAPSRVPVKIPVQVR